MKKRLSLEQESAILSLHDLKQTQTVIAQAVGCSQSSVSEVLSVLASTKEQARKVIDNGAQQLAERIVKLADVDQALEVLDRAGVLEKREVSQSKSQVLIQIGMPGQPAGSDPIIDLSPTTFASKQLGTETVSD